MAYDEGLATLIREELADLAGITEKKMFGGLCFLLHGNMICGVHQGGGMARVGQATEAEALLLEGISPLSFTGRPMGGLVDVSEEVIADDEQRARIVAMALAHAQSLPPK